MWHRGRGEGRKEALIITEAASERVFIRADEMAQQVQGLATKADDLSLILGIRMMEGENGVPETTYTPVL